MPQLPYLKLRIPIWSQGCKMSCHSGVSRWMRWWSGGRGPTCGVVTGHHVFSRVSCAVGYSNQAGWVDWFCRPLSGLLGLGTLHSFRGAWWIVSHASVLFVCFWWGFFFFFFLLSCLDFSVLGIFKTLTLCHIYSW